MNYITDNIDNNKIIISLENLENYNNYKDIRLGIDDINDIVANNENIYLTLFFFTWYNRSFCKTTNRFNSASARFQSVVCFAYTNNRLLNVA